uniref:Reverse transcriptase N-terminal domain-containing protein n=1 Tax=Gayliella sp. TaxID=2575623 RepID=A0A4D6WTD1_9FLOR|nr:hypothetical protein [Gayliella sp.]
MNYQIDKNSDWQLLPWHKINTRVILLQRKIFEASKQCDLKKISEIQNYLINSHEAKLNAVHHITYAINHYYGHENYLYNNLDKFNLFKYLFDNSKLIKAKLQLVIERIKEYLIYLCLQAEWQARSVNQLNQINKQSNLKAIKNAFQYHNIIIDNNNWSQAINNLNNLPYINTYINYWITNHYIFYSTDSNFKYLYHLLIQIYQLRFNWYNIKLEKVSCHSNINSYKLINCSDAIQISKIVNKTYLYQIKTHIYKKDVLNRYRINKNLSWKNVIRMLIKEINKYYCHSSVCSNLISIFYVLNQINYLISYATSGKYRQPINNILYYNQQALYSILYRKKMSIYLYFYLFKIIR